MKQVSKIKSNSELVVPMVNGGVPALSAADKEVLFAFGSLKISEAKIYDIGSKLNDSITKAYYHLGYTLPKEQELLALQIYLVDFFKSEKLYQNVCIDELCIAIKRGSDNQYGEFFGINPATVTGWVKSHVESESRKNAKLMQQQIMLGTTENKEPTPYEQKESFITRLEALYSMSKANKYIMPTEAIFYFDKLYKAGVIRLSDKDRNKLKIRAFEDLIPAKNPMSAKDGMEHKKLKNTYEAFLKSSINGDEVRKHAMYLGLMDWFRNLADFDLQIRDEII